MTQPNGDSSAVNLYKEVMAKFEHGMTNSDNGQEVVKQLVKKSEALVQELFENNSHIGIEPLAGLAAYSLAGYSPDASQLTLGQTRKGARAVINKINGYGDAVVTIQGFGVSTREEVATFSDVATCTDPLLEGCHQGGVSYAKVLTAKLGMLLSELGVNNVVLVGHSFGACLAANTGEIVCNVQEDNECADRYQDWVLGEFGKEALEGIHRVVVKKVVTFAPPPMNSTSYQRRVDVRVSDRKDPVSGPQSGALSKSLIEGTEAGLGDGFCYPPARQALEFGEREPRPESDALTMFVKRGYEALGPSSEEKQKQSLMKGIMDRVFQHPNIYTHQMAHITKKLFTLPSSAEDTFKLAV